MPVDTNIILQQAIAAHQLSDLSLAKNLYLSILKTNAQHADANHNLDLLYISVEQPADALPLLRRALEAHPQIEQFWVAYFEALSSAGKFSDARALLEAGRKNNLQPEIIVRLETVLTLAESGDDMHHPKPRNDPPELRIKHLAQLYESGLHQKMIDAAQQL
mgnify:FL=1